MAADYVYPAATVKPSCWAVLPQGSQFNVLAAVEDKLYILDPFEAVQQASLCKIFRVVIGLHIPKIVD